MLAAYGLLMTPDVQSMVAATYVRDIGTSRAFYELLGFREQSAGSAATSAWSSLHHGELSVLLTSTTPPLDIPQLPLLFYFFYDDVDAVIRILGTAGVQVTRTGHPPHALGGEVKVLDPDGNTVLLGQREPSASQPPAADDGATVRFSLLREAAALVSARGGTGHQCQVRGRHGRPCPNRADVKLADSMGDRAWVCLVHADEILVTVPEAFIASEDGHGSLHSCLAPSACEAARLDERAPDTDARQKGGVYKLADETPPRDHCGRPDRGRAHQRGGR
jgi:predicted enzyme related to lactoylglutathione lyase